MLGTTDYNIQLSNIEMPMLIDEASSTEIFIGTSINGSNIYTPTWKIKKIWKTGGIWYFNYPYGKQDYNYVWNNRYEYFSSVIRTGVVFNGTLALNNVYTFYLNYSPTTGITITIPSSGKIQGSKDIVVMVGDGINTPDFSTCITHPLSSDYDNTLGALNLIEFLYDGTRVWCTITNTKL